MARWIRLRPRTVCVEPLKFCVAIDRPAGLPPPVGSQNRLHHAPTAMPSIHARCSAIPPTESTARTSACRALSGSCMRSALYSRVISCSDQSYQRFAISRFSGICNSSSRASLSCRDLAGVYSRDCPLLLFHLYRCKFFRASSNMQLIHVFLSCTAHSLVDCSISIASGAH